MVYVHECLQCEILSRKGDGCVFNLRPIGDSFPPKEYSLLIGQERRCCLARVRAAKFSYICGFDLGSSAFVVSHGPSMASSNKHNKGIETSSRSAV